MRRATAAPVSKTVARVLVPAVPPPTDPEEARIHREAAAAGDEARRHVRRAELYRLKSGTPYAGEDERLVGSTFHDRDSLDQFGALAEEEEAEAERCFERLRRAHEELKDLRDRKAQQEHAAALRASNTSPPPSSRERGKAAQPRRQRIDWKKGDWDMSIAFLRNLPDGDLPRTPTGAIYTRKIGRGELSRRDRRTGKDALWIDWTKWRKTDAGGQYALRAGGTPFKDQNGLKVSPHGVHNVEELISLLNSEARHRQNK